MELSPRFRDTVTSLKLKVAKYVHDLERICHLASTTRTFEYPDFFEPKTWLFNAKGNEARFVVSADLLAAWICQLSYGARRRMEICEDEVLDALSNNRFLVAATLTRSHMEASAWVVYGLEELTKAAENSNWSKLETLIPKMLNGTAVTKKSKHMSDTSIDPLWLESSSIMNAIDALDRYYGVCTGHKSNEARIVYAILSDYAHPSIFGVKHLFYDKEEDDAGWTISYRSAETPSEDDCGIILRALLLSMRLGYSAAFMLLLGTIEDRDDGVNYIKPSPADGAGVWEHIVNVKPQGYET
jgi:hypothetical protein